MSQALPAPPRHDFESKGTANSWKHNSKSEVGAWHADEGQEERQREQKGNSHWQTDGQLAEGCRWSRASTSDWASDPFDGPGSASSQGHDSESKVCPDRSDDRKASLQEAMRKWAEQASMREDKALDIARKSKSEATSRRWGYPQSMVGSEISQAEIETLAPAIELYRACARHCQRSRRFGAAIHALPDPCFQYPSRLCQT